MIGLGLGAALALLFAGAGILRAGWTFAGALMLITALCTAALAVMADVLGFVIAAPICLGLAAGVLQKRGWLTLLVARVPLYLEILLVIAASAAFGGFRWRGEFLPTALAGVAVVAGVVAGMRLLALRRRCARM